MADIASFAQILIAIVAFAAPAVLLSALVPSDGTGSLSDLWRAPDFNAWPRGVQEEEPFRWGTTAAH
jgi:hypothetical protein